METEVTKVLCVCLGNTCRSPMMERLLRHELEKVGRNDITVESAGLRESAAGQPMAEFSMKELEQRGIDNQGHTARFVGAINLSEFDYILTVGEDEADQLMRNPDRNPNAPILILGGGVPNPWQRGEEAYRECAQHIEMYIQEFVPILLRRS